MILDVSFLVALLRGEEAAAEHAELLDRGREQRKPPSVTLLGVYEGVHRARESERERGAVLGPVFTGNAAHFRRIDGLEVETD